MNKVFVVQEPVGFDEASGEQTRKFDLSGAALFGELVYLLPPGKTPNDPQSSIQLMEEKLADFSATDYLLPIGHPLWIGCAFAIAALASEGEIKALIWVRKQGAYVPFKVSMEGFKFDDSNDNP